MKQYQMLIRVLGVVVLTICATFAARAQTTPDAKSNQAPTTNAVNAERQPAPTTSQQSPPPAEPELFAEAVEPAVGGLGLKGTICVRVAGIPIPRDDAEAARRAAIYQNWVLYLDDRPIPGLHPTSVNMYSRSFYFSLRRDAKSADAWKLLFKQFRWYQLGGPVTVSVGPEIGGTPVRGIQKDAQKFVLVVIPVWRLVALLAMYLVLGWVIFQSGRKSNMLRSPSRTEDRAKECWRPYSLGRTQMAAWFMVVVAAYLLLGLITADWTQSLNASTLGLMGIAASTALGAQAIDTSKESRAVAAPQQVAALDSQAQMLADTIKSGATPDAAAKLSEQLETVKAKLGAARVAVAARTEQPHTRGFWRDLVSDEGGVALHRVQVVVWTALLCGVFLSSVWRELAMPSFDATFLALMGISSGAYLGFKYPEKA